VAQNYPDFVQDSTYIDMDSSTPEVDQLRAMLSNLTRIHLLTANKFDSFDDLIREYIVSGIEVFGLETGIVSKISNGQYLICDVISPLEALQKGQEFSLEDTYCYEVYKSQKVLGFPEVGQLEYMRCHPVYENLKLESYLSAPIYVDDELFGTFNFTSTKVRKRGFSRHEHDLIMLMAHSIGAFVLLRNKEEKLLNLNERMKKFVGYVAHDLRNPLATIISFSKMGARPQISEERVRSIIQRVGNQAETALELVQSILQAAALSTGKITLEKTAVTLGSIFDSAMESIRPLAQEAQVSLHFSGAFEERILCDTKRIQQCLSNLLINSIKYSPKGGEVQVAAEVRGGRDCWVSISNDVNRAKDTCNESVYGSTGFGLDIVTDVMRAHGTDINYGEQEGRYRVEFSLPLAK
jgi:signal transduction histidine kinase